MKHLLLGTWVVVLLAGCEVSAPVSIASEPTSAPAAGSDSSPPPPEESWDVLYLNDSKAGYNHTRVSRIEEDGRQLVKVELITRFSLKRFGQTVETVMHLTSYETPDGELVRFDNRIENSPGSARGWVEGDKLVIETASFGKTVEQTIDWPGDVLGFSGEERLLTEHPLEPGAERTLKSLVPILNKIAVVKLVAEDYEDVELLDRTERLLRVTSSNDLTPAFTTLLWLDKTGEVLKTSANLGFIKQTTYRVSREVALEGGDGEPDADLGLDTLVKIEKPLLDAHHTAAATYEITVQDADPEKLFAQGATQTIKKLGPDSIQLRVEGITPGGEIASDRRGADPPAEYLQSNSLIQSDDDVVVQMASQAAGNAEGPWEVAKRLEGWVFENLSEKNFTRAFASAADVARNLEGDCTEHAVLLAALARARRIPARVAIGLVYVEGIQSFGYHMWTEVFVSGSWIPLDGTLGLGGIGAGHIKLSDSSLAGVDVVEQFLNVLQVIGKTKIKVLDVKP